MSDDYARPDSDRQPADSMEVVAGKATERDLEVRFTYHPPQPGQTEIYEHLRAAVYDVAKDVVAMTPASREQSLALTALEEAVFWANAAVARRS